MTAICLARRPTRPPSAKPRSSATPCVAAAAQTAADNFVVAQLIDGEPHRLWSVAADVAEAYLEGEITYDAEVVKIVFD